MSDYPRYLLRDCNVFIDRVSQIGQAEEVEIPVPEEKVEEIRNAGMVMPIEVKYGFEKLETSIKMTSFDPEVLKLFGLRVGDIREFMTTGALADEDGAVHSAVLYSRGFLKKTQSDSWKSGDKNTTDYMVSIREYKLEVDGNPIIQMTPFEVRIGGVSQTRDIRRALLA